MDYVYAGQLITKHRYKFPQSMRYCESLTLSRVELLMLWIYISLHCQSGQSNMAFRNLRLAVDPSLVGV